MLPDGQQLPALGALDAEYTLLRELGRGAMAVVYLARRRADRREVAVKIVQGGWGADNAEQLAVCAHEAATLARLDHPNIVHHLGLYATHDGGRALVMEYIAGETLRQVLLQQPRPPYDAVDSVLRDVARALAYAHAHNIVHRDVKPENIFVDEEGNRALLSDFGIAASLLAPDPAMPALVTGTPRYMSPEQINDDPIDARSDVYSLGLVGWEMIAGVRPWAGESVPEILFSQKNEALPDLRVVRPDAPSHLVLAVQAALHKDLRFRLSSVEEFLTQLDSDTPAGVTAQSRTFIRSPTLPVADMASTATPPPTVDPASDTVVFRRQLLEFPVMVPARETEGEPGPEAPNRCLRLMGAVAAGVVVLGVAGVVAKGALSEPRPAPAAASPVAASPVAARPVVVGRAQGRVADPAPRAPAARAVVTPKPAPAPRVAAPPPRVAPVPRLVPPSPARPGDPAPPARAAATIGAVPHQAVAASIAAAVAAAAARDARVERARTESAAKLTRVALGAYTSASSQGRGRSAVRTGRLRRARTLLDSAAIVQPLAPDVYLLRARVTTDLGDLRNAWIDAEMATRLGRRWEGEAMTSIVEAAALDTVSAQARVAALLKLARQRQSGVTADEGRYLALALTALGNRAGAIEALRRIEPANNDFRAVLQDPGLAPLRGDPRFAALRGRRRR